MDIKKSRNKVATILALGFACGELDDMDLEPVADRIRDMIDPLWYSMTKEERLLFYSAKQVTADTLLGPEPQIQIIDDPWLDEPWTEEELKSFESLDGIEKF
jgi:hypothetical protein